LINCDLKEIVDLFAKLLIGTFTFIGPTFTLLFSLFSKELNRAVKLNKERLKTLVLLDGENDAIQKQIRKGNKEAHLLNPKRQVVRLFGSLLLAVLLIAFFYFQHTHFWKLNFAWIRVISIVLSLTLYIYCLCVLWQIFGTIKDAMINSGEENKSKPTTLQTEKN
jgi:hypothetical protein